MRIIRIALLLSLAVIAPGRIPYVEAKPVTFAYQTPTLNSTLSLIVGVDFGFFAAEGLEVKTVFIRGGPTAIAALVGGDVDYTLVAGVPAVRAIVAGRAAYDCQRYSTLHGLHADRCQRHLATQRLEGQDRRRHRCRRRSRSMPPSRDSQRRGSCATATIRFSTAWATVHPALKHWNPEGFRLPPSRFWKDWNWSRRDFRCYSISARSAGISVCRDRLAAKRKVEADPESVVALLRGMKRGLDFLKSNKEKVAAAVIKKGIFGDPATIRKTVIHQFSDVYSLPITKEDIDAVIVAARIEAEAKKFGGAEKFFTRLLG